MKVPSKVSLSAVVLVFVQLILLSAPASVHAARLWSSGFELNSLTVELSSGSGTRSISSAQARTGTYAFRSSPASAAGYQAAVFLGTGLADQNVYARFYLYIASMPLAGTPIFEVTNSSGFTICGFLLKTDGTVQLYSFTGSGDPNSVANQIGSPSPALSTGGWYRLEVECQQQSDDDVVAAARLDGTQFASGTKAGNNTDGIWAVYMGVDVTGWGLTTTADLYFDDVAVNDTSGTAQTSWPGTGKLAISRPNVGGDTNPDGCNNTSPCGTPANAYLELDEVTPDDATSFIDLDTTNAIGDFGMQDSSALGIDSYDTVSLIDVGYRAREEASIATQFKTRLKSTSGGSVDESTQVDLGDTNWRTNQSATTAFINRHVSYLDPTTGIAWTPTGTNSLDNMQLGVTITDADDVDVSALWAYVEYVDGVAPSTSIRRGLLNSGKTLRIFGGGLRIL